MPSGQLLGHRTRPPAAGEVVTDRLAGRNPLDHFRFIPCRRGDSGEGGAVRWRARRRPARAKIQCRQRQAAKTASPRTGCRGTALPPVQAGPKTWVNDPGPAQRWDGCTGRGRQSRPGRSRGAAGARTATACERRWGRTASRPETQGRSGKEGGAGGPPVLVPLLRTIL